MSDEIVICVNCERDCSTHHIMCDEEPGDTAWCPECFEQTACSQGVHGEGCATSVISTGK